MSAATFIDALDDDFCETALTREQVLKARGIGIDAVPSAPIVAIAEPEAPRCVVCTNIIPAERQRNAKTCSDECSKTRLRQRQKRYDARYRSSDKRGATVTVLNGSSDTATPIDRSSLVLTRSDDRLLSLVSQLASAGLRLRLSIDGAELEITQH